MKKWQFFLEPSLGFVIKNFSKSFNCIVYWETYLLKLPAMIQRKCFKRISFFRFLDSTFNNPISPCLSLSNISEESLMFFCFLLFKASILNLFFHVYKDNGTSIFTSNLMLRLSQEEDMLILSFAFSFSPLLPLFSLSLSLSLSFPVF
jgi:hypothetical protein